VEVFAPRLATGGEEGSRAGDEILLGDNIGGRAELTRELDRIAAAHLQTSLLIETAGLRECAREVVPVIIAADYRVPARELVGWSASGSARA